MKRVLLLLVSIILLCGCTKNVDFKEKDIDNLFNTYLSEDTSLANQVSNGYKYYIPTGVKLLKSSNYNEELCYNGNTYYLHVDVINYYYKTRIEYEEDESLYFSKKLSYNNKEGYVEITKKDEQYLVSIYYNYAKIETYTNEKDLKNTIINLCYLLNSIKYNDSIIAFTVGEDNMEFKEEDFIFFTPKEDKNFIDYINEYDEYVEEEIESNIGKQESN